jgi:hypothetical protein
MELQVLQTGLVPDSLHCLFLELKVLKLRALLQEMQARLPNSHSTLPIIYILIFMKAYGGVDV